MVAWKIGFALVLVCLARSTFVDGGNLESCSTDRDCQSDTTFLKCKTGVCKCNNVSHFDPKKRTCVIQAGGTCDMVALSQNRKIQKCVQNSECYSNIKGAVKGICTCKKSYAETTLGTCDSGSSVSVNVILLAITLVFTGMNSVSSGS